MSKINLVVDQGNTRFKIGGFKGQELIFSEVFNSSVDLQKALDNYSFEAPILISSVGNLEWTGDLGVKFLMLDNETSLPIQLNYDTPSTLGADRIANACGLKSLFPKENALAIDFGTCITFDLIDKKGFFNGGSISPGIFMRYKSMHEYTQRLPLPEPPYKNIELGRNTEDCLHAGVMHGIALEVDARIQEIKEMYPGLRVVLTGGDAMHFEIALKSDIFADSNLTLRGLNEILLFNK